MAHQVSTLPLGIDQQYQAVVSHLIGNLSHLQVAMQLSISSLLSSAGINGAHKETLGRIGRASDGGKA